MLLLASASSSGREVMATEDEYRAKTHEALDTLWAQIDELKTEAHEA